MKISQNFVSVGVKFFYFIVGCSTISAQNSSTTSQLNCEEGIMRTGFISPTTTGELPCAEVMQTCISGQWQGPQMYDSCINLTKSCEGSPHGSVIAGYLQPTTPHGIACAPATKTCLNGSWVGPEVFTTCMELP